MTTPIVTEIHRALEPVGRDTFADARPAERQAAILRPAFRLVTGGGARPPAPLRAA
jgi:hypothetical protein